MEEFDVPEPVLPGVVAGRVGSASDGFPYREMGEALGHNIGLAAVSAGTAPVDHLSSDPGQRCTPGHPGLRNLLALIAQILCQLAVAMDLAAVRPGLPDQLGLARNLLRSVACRSYSSGEGRLTVSDW
ncbi:hypothetical protein AB0T83_19395 [Fluviibacterium sp. DFM31]|uniref:Uncharacterized protein n=1 Tax=Meridianimarinicoccus marinus TaxID=3231483 RepID=A0ABV3LD31_9RHOB